MGGTGREPPPLAGPGPAIPADLRAEPGTPEDRDPAQDPDLAHLIKRWSRLSKAARQAITVLSTWKEVEP